MKGFTIQKVIIQESLDRHLYWTAYNPAPYLGSTIVLMNCTMSPPSSNHVFNRTLLSSFFREQLFYNHRLILKGEFFL